MQSAQPLPYSSVHAASCALCRFGGLPSLGFERLTLVPIQTKMVEASIMSADEIAWLDQYHQQVRRPLLQASPE